LRHPLLFSVVSGFVLLAILGVVIPLREQEGPQREDDEGAGQAGIFQSTCATCHGQMGEGNRGLMTPSIASLPRWYIEEQIRKFRNGQRGGHPEDIHGQQMRAAIELLSEDEIAEAIDYLDGLPAVRHVGSLGGDAVAGYELYRENCMACHRFNGHGEVVFRSASLNGLQDWYLLAQLGKFQQGIRGYHPDDESGVKMRKAVSYLASEQEKLDILALLVELANKYPVNK
jgi:cytochrome c553